MQKSNSSQCGSKAQSSNTGHSDTAGPVHDVSSESFTHSFPSGTPWMQWSPRVPILHLLIFSLGKYSHGLPPMCCQVPNLSGIARCLSDNTIYQSPIPQILHVKTRHFSLNLSLLVLLSSFYHMVAPLSTLLPNLRITEINLDPSSLFNSTEWYLITQALKKIPFTKARKIKYLGVILTKAQDIILKLKNIAKRD